jgi:hypothetical protein
MPTSLTIWEAVDEFLKDMASGTACTRPRYTDSEYYMRLVNTACRGTEDALELIDVKPYYPFILIAYYVLFHRHDLDLARKILGKLGEYYEKYPYTFTRDEKCAFEMLREVTHDFEVMRGTPREAYEDGGLLGTRLREVAHRLDLDFGDCGGWSALFRLLLQSHLDVGNRERYWAVFVEEFGRMQRRLREVYEDIERAEREDEARYPGEDINYYILLPTRGEEPSPIEVFIGAMFERGFDPRGIWRVIWGS